MKENALLNNIRNIAKSKFLRSVFLRIVFIFLIVIIFIVAIVFFSFTSEINKNILLSRQQQLEEMEKTISKRMDEIASISYNIGNDKAFYLEPVAGDKYSGYEMSETLARYLVGNDFIEHLAYYRLSEPDIIYVSSGELSFNDFWHAYMGLDDVTAKEMTDDITGTTETLVRYISFGGADKTYFSYVYPLPQFSKNPRAYVLGLIPYSEVEPLMDAQLANCCGEIIIYNADNKEICRKSNIDGGIPFEFSDEKEGYFSYDGKAYVVQTAKSSSNGWTYVSVVRLNDIISATAARQLVFIILLLVLMLAAVVVVFMSIIVRYKPINKLAVSVSEKTSDGDDSLIDEESLLSNTFATLKDDSEQKQRFETAYYAAEAANKAKSAFLSNMSHDIRTPMNAIVGMTEIAVNNVDNPEYVKECLQKVRLSSQYLLDIINNVLDMSRIESGKFTLSEGTVELPKLVRSVIAMLNQSMTAKSQQLVVEVNDVTDENVVGDSVRLTQVFVNILSNSVKFTPSGGTIRLEITQTSSADGCGDYVFIFSDTGIGMSSEFISKVFDTFTRDEKPNVSRIEGTGLGMAIAKSFVEMMGGKIECKSELGKGTEFTVSLRLKTVADATADKSPERYADTAVLVLGDEKQAKLFESIGANTEYAADVTAAVAGVKRAVLENRKFDFVILSQSEKDKSGTYAISEISGAAAADNMTFVFVAADIFSVDKKAAGELGIKAFVQAPLFGSTAREILDRKYESSDSADKQIRYNFEGVRVLLAEDNPINREIACAQLRTVNAEVTEAENGKKAVENFRNHDVGYFGVILMDVQMPVMNGYEATAVIRSMERDDAKTVPIYAMTANTFDEDVRQVKEAGMDGHLGKPYEAEELYETLEQALKRSDK